MIFDNTSYKCLKVTEWTNCNHRKNTPSRKLTRISEPFLIKYPCLKLNANNPIRILNAFRTTDESGNDIVHG